MENRTALLRRIRALAAKTMDNGCTEQEALAAASLLARLVDKYGFTPADLDDPMEPLTEATIDVNRTMSGNQHFALSIAKFCDCKVFYRAAKFGKEKEIVFFGHETDVLMCRYMMDLLGTANESGFKAFISEKKAAADGRKITRKEVNADRRGFDWGMASRIKARLEAMKADRNGAVDESTGKAGAALVVVKNAAVEAEYAKRYKISTKTALVRRANLDAYNAGQVHGDRVAINPGVNGGAQLALV
ncbi:MAG TPA: DUF2786 domain-containing protein [Candidatus Eisenbacteria bacterium]|nr:DUF2786 domain-containing protein [Candidatus Eisenbacteria bacterium]